MAVWKGCRRKPPLSIKSISVWFSFEKSTKVLEQVLSTDDVWSYSTEPHLAKAKYSISTQTPHTNCKA